MSQTPRTDAACVDPIKFLGLKITEDGLVTAHFARTLERELAEAKQLAAYKDETATTFMNQVKKLQADQYSQSEAIRAAREALDAIPLPALTASGADAMAYHLEKKGTTEIKPGAEALWLRELADQLEKFDAAKERALTLLAQTGGGK
jgi:hypothetical protein